MKKRCYRYISLVLTVLLMMSVVPAESVLAMGEAGMQVVRQVGEEAQKLGEEAADALEEIFVEETTEEASAPSEEAVQEEEASEESSASEEASVEEESTEELPQEEEEEISASLYAYNGYGDKDETEKLFRKSNIHAVYNTNMQAPYQPNLQEKVQTASGNLDLYYTDLTLPGKNGLDFSLNRYYKSQNSYDYDGCYGWVYNGYNAYFWGKIEKSQSKKGYYLPAMGWDFDLPYIKDSVMYLGSKGVYEFGSQSDESGLKDYPLNDLKFEQGYYFSKLTYKDGTIYTFDDEFNLIRIENKYGDRIEFSYEGGGTDRRRGYLKVTDTVGRIIEFYELRNSKLVATGIEVVVIEDGKTVFSINYALEPLENSALLTSYTNQEGQVTAYSYCGENNGEVYSYSFGILIAGVAERFERKYYLLNEIAHPNGRTTHFEYTRAKKCLMEGSGYWLDVAMEYRPFASYMDYPVLSKRYDSGSTEGVRQTATYTYAIDASETTGISSKTTVVDALSRMEVYTHDDEEGHVTKTKLYEGNNESTSLMAEADYAYNEDKLMIKSQSKTYNLSSATGSNLSSTPLTVTEDMEYDGYGNLTSYWGPKADRDNEGNLQNKDGDKNRVTYTYYPESQYCQLQTKHYFRDNNTEIEERNTLTDDGKDIAWQEVWEKTGGGSYVLQKQVQMLYNKGNLIEKREYINGAVDYRSNPSSITMTDGVVDSSIAAVSTFDYTDNQAAFVPDSANRTGFDGAYPTKITLHRVKDADGQLVEPKSGESAGTIVNEVYYDYFGRPAIQSDGNGNKTFVTYDKMGRTTKEQFGENGPFRTYAYSVPNNTVVFTDENGTRIEQKYDVLNNPIHEKDLKTNAILIRYEYDALNRPTGVFNDKNLAVYSEYDKLDRLIKQEAYEQPRGAAAKSGTLVYTQSQQYRIVNNSGDSANPVLLEVSSTLGEAGHQDAPPIVQKEYFDKANQVVRRSANHNGVEDAYADVYTYDFLGNCLTEKQARATADETPWSLPDGDFTTRYTYNFMNQVVKTEQATSNLAASNKTLVSATASYDALGRKISETDFKGTQKTYSYDNAGRLVEARTPVENAFMGQKFYYDANGNRIAEKTTADKTDTGKYSKVSYTYDDLNRLIQQISYKDIAAESTELGSCTQYYYDAAGNVLRVYTGMTSPLTITGPDQVSGTDEDYSVTKYTYDHFKRVTSMTDPLGQTETYVYDNVTGLLTQAKDRNGNTLHYTYDALGNVTSLETKKPDGTTDITQQYAYNLYGSLMSQGELRYAYDDLGRVISEKNTKNNSESLYTYDAAGNCTYYTLKVDNKVSVNLGYLYDKSNRMQQVNELNPEGSRKQVLVRYRYDENGNETVQENVANGIKTEYTYDMASRLTELNQKKGSELLDQYVYTYYLNGYKAGETGMNSQKSYTYDGLGRLTAEEAGSDSQTAYTYDSFGNRKTMTSALSGESTQTAYTYDKNNRMLTASTVTDGTEKSLVSYSYDANGNTLMERRETYDSPSGEAAESVGFGLLGTDAIENLKQYTYNTLNQLTGFSSDGTTAAYTYQTNGLRASKTVNGKTTNHIWNGQNMVAETDGSGKVSSRYYRGTSLIGADLGESRSYYLYNGHGDVTGLSDSAGNIKNSYDYNAFGGQSTFNASDSNPFRYAGEYYDSESGMIYLRARYYSPETGRFLTEDPIHSGMNWYSYCSNDPINRIDPWGLVDVFARDYLEERGAEVNYTGNGTASVKYNGETYNISGTINSDGRMVMDDADIDNIFGWTSTVYYFYGSDQTDHATRNIKDLRNNGYAVVPTLVTSTSCFTDAYNAMPSTVDIVIVNQHGNPFTVSYMNLSQLDMTKSISTFVLLSCNAGHQWTGSESMASKIANASGGNIGQLISADGTHFRGRFWNPFRGIKVEGDSTWKDYIDSSLRNSAKSQGFIRYQWNDTSYQKDSIGNSFSSVKSLLRKAGV